MGGFEDFLSLINLRVHIYLNARVCGEWRLDAQPAGETCFHMATQDQADLDVPGVGDWRLQEGDLVIFPRELAHTLRPAGKMQGPHQQWPLSDAQHLPGTSFICGKVQFTHSGSQLLLDALPSVFVIRRDVRTPWLQHFLSLILDESLRSEGDNSGVLDRLCELLFAYALRYYVENCREPMGVFTLFSHRQISRAIRAFHQSPDKPWQLTTLAERAAMSRTQFAQTFKSLSGWTPMQYATWWRMQLAWSCLTSGLSVADAAEKVGYQSEAAFSRAFRKQFKVSAGAVRRGQAGEMNR